MKVSGAWIDRPATHALEFTTHSGVINEFIESLKTGSTPQTI